MPVAQVNKHGVTVKTFTEEQVEPVSACDGELIATDAVQAVTDCRDEHTECREAPARLSHTGVLYSRILSLLGILHFFTQTGILRIFTSSSKHIFESMSKCKVQFLHSILLDITNEVDDDDDLTVVPTVFVLLITFICANMRETQ